MHNESTKMSDLPEMTVDELADRYRERTGRQPGQPSTTSPSTPAPERAEANVDRSDGRISCPTCEQRGAERPRSVPAKLIDGRLEAIDVCEECAVWIADQRKALQRQAQQEQLEAERQRIAQLPARIHELLAMTGVNVDEYGDASFDTFDPRPDAHALEAAREFAAAVLEDPNRRLYMSSARAGERIAPGAGKTHLAVAILRDLILDGHYRPSHLRFEYAPRLLLEIRATFQPGAEHTALDIIRRCTSPDVLVLDDLGTTRWSEFTIETMATIAEERAGRATIVTSNFRLTELRDRALEDSDAGWAIDRVLSRLAKNARMVELTGRDRRLRA